MGVYTVTSQAQALWSDDIQADMTIVNDGPFTVLLDSQSGINEQSMSLPPTASIVWTAGKALWIKSVGTESRVRTTPNSVLMDASRAGVTKRLYVSNSVFASVSNTFVAVPAVECSTFRALIVAITYDSSVADTVWHMKMDWYDDANNLILTETNTIFLFDASGVGTLKWNTSFPVKGANAIVSIRADSAGAKNFPQVQIFGTTNAMPFRATPGINAEVRLGTHGLDYDRDLGCLAAPFDLGTTGAAISLAPLGEQLSVRIFTPLGVTVAGVVRIRDSLQNVVKYGQIDIPVRGVANGNVDGGLFYVPRGRGVDISVDTGATFGGTCRMTAVWVDYEAA